jgi:hypothetical protein
MSHRQSSGPTSTYTNTHSHKFTSDAACERSSLRNGLSRFVKRSEICHLLIPPKVYCVPGQLPAADYVVRFCWFASVALSSAFRSELLSLLCECAN